MASKLFRRDIEPVCELCSAGRPSAGGDFVLCPKKGVMDAGACCPHFDYDPLRRKVRRRPPLDTSVYRPEDFRL